MEFNNCEDSLKDAPPQHDYFDEENKITQQDVSPKDIGNVSNNGLNNSINIVRNHDTVLSCSEQPQSHTPPESSQLEQDLQDIDDPTLLEWIFKASQKQKQITEDFDKEIEKYRITHASSSIEDDENNIKAPGNETIQEKEPNIFNGSLKNYQLKGMKWLVSLYEKGFNGILADEMGLGKTIQTIAFMAYLAEKKNNWGPTLIITPSSKLYNWQEELEKFCPTLRILPYWGALKERKLLRKNWTNPPDTLYQKDSPFHVVISSYGLVLEDEKYFKKVKWQYLILDEAPAIQSSKSLRLKTLLSLNCRNRLLLTSNYIQNNMKELWALLDFIMPSIFDSQDELFNDHWFLKAKEQDIELDEQQLATLHMILKPFMLRRVKKDIESETAQDNKE